MLGVFNVPQKFRKDASLSLTSEQVAAICKKGAPSLFELVDTADDSYEPLLPAKIFLSAKSFAPQKPTNSDSSDESSNDDSDSGSESDPSEKNEDNASEENDNESEREDNDNNNYDEDIGNENMDADSDALGDSEDLFTGSLFQIMLSFTLFFRLAFYYKFFH